jgi:CRP-like cAMP-binding protein
VGSYERNHYGAVTWQDLGSGGNALLAEASRADLRALQSASTRVRFDLNASMIRANEHATAAFFIEEGVASVVKSSERGRRTEICLIGPEGFAGSAIVMVDGQWPYETFAQVDNVLAVRIEGAALRSVYESSASFRAILGRAIHIQTLQIAEGLVSAAWFPVIARLARWLLMYRDRLGSSHIQITHEFMALMIGTQRTRITASLHEMEAIGAIKSGRGLLIIKDVRLLQDMAEGGYGELEQEAGRLGALATGPDARAARNAAE